ncbi:GAF and ANTAR domain-containing protein [Lentzea flaviverrucosa]|uniref:GAF domain-containing protein n=1 Tax=Lentzea flaviverrucosa TaxID=200379 RepID=A0A1H9GYZ8_9PSEU|nr:GAF and ANTAR domain-containing protein [Lentzea flaviverrucosa]RDI34755.1 GAF domain-containing protein [Lentzea flaviverrucosa]SEQ55346.1 GAF domain-containing protein [Lentzea flaviverrucosa]
MNHDLPLADELAAVSARMSGLLLSRETVGTALHLVTSLAGEALPGATGAGVSLLDEHGRRTTAAATDPLVEHLDGLQYEMGEGPCLTAWEGRHVLRVDDIAGDDRWPRWSAAAGDSAMRSALSAPLVAGGDALGAIKVYGREPGAFGERDEYLLTMFAAQSAILVANVRTFENATKLSEALADALRGRDMISIAKGIVMAREHVDEEAAFALLARNAREENGKLRDLAGTLLRSTVRWDR